MPCLVDPISYGATFNYFIHLVNSQQYWEPTPYVEHVPPNARMAAGRPKKHEKGWHWGKC